jgi:carboxymethylenebutenolidase
MIGERLAALGYLAMVPDYWRGNGAPDPDDYEHLEVLHEMIARMDFRTSTLDMLAGIDFVRRHPDVDPDRVAVWGYCTGGTLAMLAAAFDRRLAAAVLFYPSQVTFPELTVKRPTAPLELMWAITCPTILFCGDADHAFPDDLRAEMARRIDAWQLDVELVVYPGADHVFAGLIPARYRQDYDEDSWRRATALVARELGGREG